MTIKCDEYGFTLFKFDRLIPYSTDSFAFPLRVQQVFFVDDGRNDGWKVVLRREPRGCRVMLRVDGGPDLQALQIGRCEPKMVLTCVLNPLKPLEVMF